MEFCHREPVTEEDQARFASLFPDLEELIWEPPYSNRYGWDRVPATDTFVLYGLNDLTKTITVIEIRSYE